MNSNDFDMGIRTAIAVRASGISCKPPHDVAKGGILEEAMSGYSLAESRMRGDLHVWSGGRGYPDPTITMSLQCYLAELYM
jgi:hypothetical protein